MTTTDIGKKQLLQKLARYYGFELAIIDFAFPKTYEKFEWPNKKKSVRKVESNERFVALFYKNDYVVFSGASKTSKKAAAAELLQSYESRRSVTYKELKYSHRLAYKMFNDYVDIENVSALELMLAIRRG